MLLKLVQIILTTYNLNHIKKYIRGEGGYVVMNDGSSVAVSVRKKPEVLEKLTLF